MKGKKHKGKEQMRREQLSLMLVEVDRVQQGILDSNASVKRKTTFYSGVILR